jgi:hypothetical protein
MSSLSGAPATRPTSSRAGSGGSDARRVRGDWVTVADYQLSVLATSVDDVVVNIGGWLCDMSLAGWSVTVTSCDASDERALRILGARVIANSSLSAALPRIVANTCGAMAISSSLLVDGPACHRQVDAALQASAHSCIWGQPGPVSDVLDLRMTRYRPSAAALAFKAQALLATGRTASPSVTTESLMRPYCVGASSPLV